MWPRSLFTSPAAASSTISMPAGPGKQPRPSSFRASLFQQFLIIAMIAALGLLTLHSMFLGTWAPPAGSQTSSPAEATKEATPPPVVPVQVLPDSLDNTTRDDEPLDMAVGTAHTSSWSYRCFAPVNANPKLTVVTPLADATKQYTQALRRNRLLHASRHAYRYCELHGNDEHHRSTWAKFPLLMAMFPCSNFTLFLDTDAIIGNLDLNFLPWMNYMDEQGLDQLFPASKFPESAIDYGVMLVRNTKLVLNFLKRVYNECPCSHARLHDHPSEHGLLYDLLANDQHSPETKHSRIVAPGGWDRVVDDGGLPSAVDLVIHLVRPTMFPPGSSCTRVKRFTRDCRYQGLTHYIESVLGQQAVDDDSTYGLVEQGGCGCRTIRSVKSVSSQAGSLAVGPGSTGAHTSTVLDYDLDPVTGQLLEVWVSEVACPVSSIVKTCRLPGLWDERAGSGVWGVVPARIKQPE